MSLLWFASRGDSAGRLNAMDSLLLPSLFLLHVYKKGCRPFQSLSALPHAEAVAIMSKLYIEGSVFWERFKDPDGYLSFRKQVEENLRSGFVSKGGRPKAHYPICLMLGRPTWPEQVMNAATIETTDEIEVPLSTIEADQISFTYPDSMVKLQPTSCAALKSNCKQRRSGQSNFWVTLSLN
jgi:hypothetical protein